MTRKYSSASTWLTSQVAVFTFTLTLVKQDDDAVHAAIPRRTMSSERESERLCPHPNKVSSTVWFFGFKENTLQNLSGYISAKGGNTTKLFTHLRVYHPADYAILQRCEKMDLRIIQSLLERVQICKKSLKPKNLQDLEDFSEEQSSV